MNLSVHTLHTYTAAGRSDLVRGADFYVQRYGKYRRKLFFTARGMERLASRAYRTFSVGEGSKDNAWLPPFFVQADNRYGGKSMSELRQRLRQQIFFAMLKYRETPCAVPNCPCMIHRLGVPQAAEVYEVFPPGGRKK